MSISLKVLSSKAEASLPLHLMLFRCTALNPAITRAALCIEGFKLYRRLLLVHAAAYRES